jgi:hypothetical protein
MHARYDATGRRYQSSGFSLPETFRDFRHGGLDRIGDAVGDIGGSN